MTVIETEVEVICKCGEYLDAAVNIFRGETTITVDPCPACLQREYAKGYEEDHGEWTSPS